MTTSRQMNISHLTGFLDFDSRGCRTSREASYGADINGLVSRPDAVTRAMCVTVTRVYHETTRQPHHNRPQAELVFFKFHRATHSAAFLFPIPSVSSRGPHNELDGPYLRTSVPFWRKVRRSDRSGT